MISIMNKIVVTLSTSETSVLVNKTERQITKTTAAMANPAYFDCSEPINKSKKDISIYFNTKKNKK